jgi:hypothetical protein
MPFVQAAVKQHALDRHEVVVPQHHARERFVREDVGGHFLDDAGLFIDDTGVRSPGQAVRALEPVLLRRLQQHLRMIRKQQVVVVQEADPFTPGLLQGEVAGDRTATARVDAKVAHVQPVAELFAHRLAFVRIVLDHDGFDRPVRLVQHRGQGLPQKGGAAVGADQDRDQRLGLRLLRRRKERMERAFAPHFVPPAGEARFETGRGPVRVPEIPVVARELDERPCDALAAAREGLRNHHLRERHRHALQDAPVARIARAIAQVGVDALQHLQRLDLVRLCIGVMHDGRPRHIAQPESRAAQAPGQLDVFPVHEDLRLEAADGSGGAGAKQDRGAAHPLGLLRHRVVILRMLVRNLPHFPGGDFLAIAAGRLAQQHDRTRLRNRVLVQHQHIVRTRDGDQLVDGGSEAEVGAAGLHQFNHQSRGPLALIERLQAGRCCRAGIVVPQEDAQARNVGGFPADRRQTLGDVIQPGPVNHHQDVNHCGPRKETGAWRCSQPTGARMPARAATANSPRA